LHLQVLEIDGVRYELRCSVLRCTAATVIIAISSYYHHRQIWTALFDLRQQLQAIHARHVDLCQDGQQLELDVTRKAVQYPDSATIL
jgi:hypothetical protein